MPNPGFPFSIGAGNGTGFNATVPGITVGGNQGQMFKTLSLPNSRLALYTLTIRDPDPPNAPIITYTFPLSPQSVSKEYVAVNNIYDVAGNASQGGVQRIADIYGNSPAMFVLRGTTGWQYHATDGYAMSGLESIAAIQDALNQYAQLNKSRMENNNPSLYVMEFYDYFSETFWQVIPLGKQTIDQDERRPLLFFYTFRLAGIKAVDAPLPPETDDPVLNLLALSQPQAISALSLSLTTTLNGYAANTAGSTGVTLL